VVFWQVRAWPLPDRNITSPLAPPADSLAIERYVKETNRLYGLNKRWPTGVVAVSTGRRIRSVRGSCAPRAGNRRSRDFPALKRWFQAIHDRPAPCAAYEKAAPSTSVQHRPPHRRGPARAFGRRALKGRC